MRNALWYLGFVSLMSLLYFVRWDPGFMLFASFAMFFFTYRARDERVAANEGRAARNAFLYVMSAGAAGIAYVTLTGNTALYECLFAAVMAGALVVCVLSFLYYDIKGR